MREREEKRAVWITFSSVDNYRWIAFTVVNLAHADEFHLDGKGGVGKKAV